MPVCGFLNLHKPRGLSSRRVVDRVVPLVKPAKAGHAGTLDPLAEGVLVVGVGAATRLIAMVQAQTKEYVGGFLLGRTSTTEDIEGEVRELPSPPTPTIDQLQEAARRWTGDVWQTPPAFSALKIAGQRAYRMARRGETPPLAPREITVYELEVVRYAYPELVLRMRVSAGTYARTLGRDLARTVGTDCVMSSLVRTAVGPFGLADAVPVEALDRDTLLERLQPPLAAVADWPKHSIDDTQVALVRQGRAIELPAVEAPRVVLVDARGAMVALAEPRAEGRYGPSLVLPEENP